MEHTSSETMIAFVGDFAVDPLETDILATLPLDLGVLRFARTMDYCSYELRGVRLADVERLKAHLASFRPNCNPRLARRVEDAHGFTTVLWDRI